MKSDYRSPDAARNDDQDDETAKYIRSLGTRASNSSQPPSLSHSPSLGTVGVCSQLRNGARPPRSVSLTEGAAQEVGNGYNTASSSSVYSMAQSGGNGSYRVAQACDRCRAKKTRCDGKRPQCSQCALVGFECKVSDKLSRKAFPRGYTETLEERVRELEAENRRLVALCDIKEQQIHLVSEYSSRKSEKPGMHAKKADERMLQELRLAGGGSLQVSSTNLYLLNKTRDGRNQDLGNPSNANGNGNGNGNANQGVAELDGHEEDRNVTEHLKIGSEALIVNPVSANLNDPTSVSFEQNEAPGLPAVKALTSMSTREQSSQLATLVALSVPRSTEEILFIPQLLARIRQIYGFTSKQCLYSVSLLSSLKANLPEPQLMKWDALDYLKGKNLWEIDDLQKFLTETLKFNSKTERNNNELIDLSFTEIDELVQLFFTHWSAHIPILNKEEFFSYYDKFKNDVHNEPTLLKSDHSNFATRSKMISYKIFACILLILCQMGLLIKVKTGTLPPTSNYTKLISYYHRAINLMYLNPYFSVLTTSLQSLQFLSLSLFYFLNVGNISAIYELRGRVVSMAQQLRLHRCPSAVLGGSGSTMNKREQGDRRVLFWGIYYLDVFAALQLGVPRLFKDFEIECALPVSDNDDKKVSLAGQMIRLEGCVSQFSLAVIRFAKVLGNILDSIFKRGLTESIVKEIALIHENALDNWRRGLPSELIFEIDVNGTINMDKFTNLTKTNAVFENMEGMVLLILYFLAKSMIHLPVVATRRLESNEDTSPGKNINRSGVSDSKENVLDQFTIRHRSSSSYVLLQQATNTLLKILESMTSIYLPLPVNVARTKARFSLISARGLLEYTKGGALFLDHKTLLLDVVNDIEEDRKLEIPGIISWHSLKLLDMTINLLLQPPNIAVEKLDKLLKKKLNYYNRLMGRPTVRSPSISQGHTKRKMSTEDNYSNSEIDIKNSNLTPASSKGDRTPPAEKKLKIEHNDEGIKSFENEKTSFTDLDKEGTHKDEHNDPAMTKNAIAEAFQLDPVLNNNFLSDIDLAMFFASYDDKTDVAHGKDAVPIKESQFETRGPQDTSVIAPELKRNHNISRKLSSITGNSRAVSNSALNGLFRVPSNADFLNDEYYFPGGSQFDLPQYSRQNNLNPPELQSTRRQNNNASTTLNAGTSFSNSCFNSLFDHMPSANNRNDNSYANKLGTGKGNSSGVPSFTFAVDASLGLAPLLAWTPDMTVHTNTVANRNNNGNDRTGVILDSTIQPDDYTSEHGASVLSLGKTLNGGPHVAEENSYTNIPLLENQKLPALLDNENKPDSATETICEVANDDSIGNEVLTLSSRRRPRRRQTHYSQGPTQDKNLSQTSHEIKQHPSSLPHNNLQDLFQWQNSK